MAAIRDCPRSLVLVGAGKMGGAMLEGWLAAGLPPSTVTVIDPGLATTPAGVSLNPPAGAVLPPEVLVLAIKPQGLAAAAADLGRLAGPGTLVLSILAGKTVADVSLACPGTDAIVRAMPNLPASIGRGASGAFASPGVSARQRDLAHALLSATGLVEWVDGEAAIDAVTALSGSGPAYLFHLCECLAQAGVAAGLEAGMAERLARATVTGAAELLATSPLSPATLRANVTSPGGTTQAALAVLAGPHGLAPLMRDTVAAAQRRAAELAG